MREINFRGMRTDTGDKAEWICGSLIDYNDTGAPYRRCIRERSEGCICPVAPETVGQFTGLCDRNGVEIYEGDVIAYCGEQFLTAMVCCGEYNENGGNCAKSDSYGWYFDAIQCQKDTCYNIRQPLRCIDGKAAYFPKYCGITVEGVENLIVEVIGNIHENKDLLTKK